MMFRRVKRKPDLEQGLRDGVEQEALDFTDESWIIDHHRQNLIEKIFEPEDSWLRAFRRLGRSARRSEERNNATVNGRGSGEHATCSDDSEPRVKKKQSYRMNLAELQRLRLRQIQRKLVQHVVDLRYDAMEPDGWAEDLKEYVQGLRDYDYMCRFNTQSTDPFSITGERLVERHMLQSAMIDMENEADPLRWAKAVGRWETERGRPEPIGGTRDVNFQKAFQQRVIVAAIGGAFLIGPMWLMVLHKTLYTALISTTLFVAVFGLIMAVRLDRLMDVMSASAAYAAVLVVFVGLTTT